MSEGFDEYLSQKGIKMGAELKHYGKKGMKWGVRNEASSSGGGGRAWTDDQKKKARNVAIVAGVVAVGAAYAATQIYANGADQRILNSVRSGTPKLGATLPSLKGLHDPIPPGFFKDIVRGGKVQQAAKEGVMSDAFRKTSAGAKAAESFLKTRGSGSLSLDPATRAFIKDAPNRILSDQRGWSKSFGQSLNSIQKEDAAFMAEYIKNFAPKALGG